MLRHMFTKLTTVLLLTNIFNLLFVLIRQQRMIVFVKKYLDFDRFVDSSLIYHVLIFKRRW